MPPSRTTASTKKKLPRKCMRFLLLRRLCCHILCKSRVFPLELGLLLFPQFDYQVRVYSRLLHQLGLAVQVLETRVLFLLKLGSKVWVHHLFDLMQRFVLDQLYEFVYWCNSVLWLGSCYLFDLALGFMISFSEFGNWEVVFSSNYQFVLLAFCCPQLDRFIPNRSAMDFDYAHYMLTEGRKDKENPAVSSPSREAYRKQLAETFNMNRTRILAFKNKVSFKTSRC